VEVQLGEWPLIEDSVEHRSFPRFILLIIIKFSQENAFPLSGANCVIQTGREGVGRDGERATRSGQRIQTQAFSKMAAVKA